MCTQFSMCSPPQKERNDIHSVLTRVGSARSFRMCHNPKKKAVQAGLHRSQPQLKGAIKVLQHSISPEQTSTAALQSTSAEVQGHTDAAISTFECTIWMY